MTEERVVLVVEVDRASEGAIGDLLAARTELSKRALRDALSKGAVWVTPARHPDARRRSSTAGRRRRVRTAKARVRAGDTVELRYDRRALAFRPPRPSLVASGPGFTVWFKPCGLFTQGTPWGDHASLERAAERERPDVRIVHRLDREASGLVVVAHDRATAAGLSEQFREGRVEKVYEARVSGDHRAAHGDSGVIDRPLDGKSARTTWSVVSYDPAGDATTLEVRTETGRLHQVRRHLAGIGAPIHRDARYGAGSAARDDAGPESARGSIALAAVRLSFTCPASRRRRTFACGARGPSVGDDPA